jgi:methylthioribose-1-phosphate isomerase
MFSAMRYDAGCLHLIDQKLLPSTEHWIACDTLEKVAVAIETMVVRGAPAIGCAAAWGLAIDALRQHPETPWDAYTTNFERALKRMAQTRPTAVNLFYAIDAMRVCAAEFSGKTPMAKASELLVAKARYLADDDIKTCKAIGDLGASLMNRPANVLTHCNTGSLATAGYGTALGIVRSMHERGHIKRVWVDETRPYLQGARLTAFELGQDQIPYTLITDNMAATLMRQGQVDMVVVGADRIATNGDTANKIGTYGLAVLCAHHKIPLIVAAPRATIDFSIASGAAIPVEERPDKELKEIHGIAVAPRDAHVWNPSFDVTPAELIHAIITEDGIFKGPNYRFTPPTRA